MHLPQILGILENHDFIELINVLDDGGRCYRFNNPILPYVITQLSPIFPFKKAVNKMLVQYLEKNDYKHNHEIMGDKEQLYLLQKLLLRRDRVLNPEKFDTDAI